MRRFGPRRMLACLVVTALAIPGASAVAAPRVRAAAPRPSLSPAMLVPLSRAASAAVHHRVTVWPGVAATFDRAAADRLEAARPGLLLDPVAVGDAADGSLVSGVLVRVRSGGYVLGYGGSDGRIMTFDATGGLTSSVRAADPTLKDACDAMSDANEGYAEACIGLGGIPCEGEPYALAAVGACYLIWWLSKGSAPTIYPNPKYVHWWGTPTDPYGEGGTEETVYRDGSGYSYPLADFEVLPNNCLGVSSDCRDAFGNLEHNNIRVTYYWPDGVVSSATQTTTSIDAVYETQHTEHLGPGTYMMFIVVELATPELLAIGYFQYGGLYRAVKVV
jgi:hypothetical protein